MLSIVVPVFNEEESLATLLQEISEVAATEDYDLEIIFVDDGSTDGSWRVIRQLSAEDSRIRAIHFRRNFGKAAALSAGFTAARGEWIMTLDADLQDDPNEIPRFLAQAKHGFDVVSGWKQIRHDPWHKVIPSRFFNAMVSKLTGVTLHDHNCGMKCYRREIFDEVRLYGELHRFVPVLAAARGFRVGELVIHHRARKFGKSKYGFCRFIKGFLDLLTVKFLTGFGQRPQHILGTTGLISLTLGALGMFYLSCYWIVSQFNPDLGLMKLTDRPALLYSACLLLLGAQLIGMGFLAELIVACRDRDLEAYSVDHRIDDSDADNDLDRESSSRRRSEWQSPDHVLQTNMRSDSRNGDGPEAMSETHIQPR